jgi:hypothetical protein
MPQLASWQRSLADSLTVALVFSGDADEIARLSEQHDLQIALVQRTDETFTDYGMRATPSAVLVDVDGAIASAPAEGGPPIEALIRAAVAQARPAALVVHHA